MANRVSALEALFYLILTIIAYDYSYYTHFTEEGTKAQEVNWAQGTQLGKQTCWFSVHITEEIK